MQKDKGVRRRSCIKQPRPRVAAPPPRVWLHRIGISELARQKFVQLHHAKRAGERLEDAEVRSVVGQKDSRALFGDCPRVTALVATGGFAFQLGGSASQFGGSASEGVFAADMFMVLHKSRQLRRDFATVLHASAPVGITETAVLPDVLSSILPSWRSIRERPPLRDTEECTLQLSERSGEELRRREYTVDAACFSVMRKQLLDPRGGSSVDVGDLCVTVSGGEPARVEVAPAGIKYDIYTGVFGRVVEHKVPDTFLYGMRAVLRDVVCALSKEPRVYETTPLDADTADCDNLVQLVRSLGLVTSLPEDSANGAVFRMLNITHRAPTPLGESNVSVFPLSHAAQSGAVSPRPYVAALSRAGVLVAEAHQAALGGFALYTQYRLFGVKRPPSPVLLNSPRRVEGTGGDVVSLWKTTVLDCVANMRTPLSTLLWYDEEVKVHSALVDGTRAIVFSDEKGVVAIAGLPATAIRGGFYDHTPYCRGLASGEPVEPVSAPRKKAFEVVQGGSFAAAARRLAYLDALTTGFPQFSEHANLLRGIWLYSEKERLAASGLDTEDFSVRMGVLSQMRAAPRGCNFWATVPYVSRSD